MPETETKKQIQQIIEKIEKAENILVALSRDPSVDEIAAAIGLTIYLDETGKHATAIYSGLTPKVLGFLQPEKTLEPNTNSLRDFIIALNKEKADHLRYKLDGDYVKVFITPYRTTISEKDLEFSHGDLNVDLVVAMDVTEVAQLDAALVEHGRIMHDATTINITAAGPGKFAETEWSEPTASSVSEMVAKLVMELNGDKKLAKESATAFLAGIVAATNRFSNTKTTAEGLSTAAKLMSLGAEQQLVMQEMAEGKKEELETKPEETILKVAEAVEESKAPEVSGKPEVLGVSVDTNIENAEKLKIIHDELAEVEEPEKLEIKREETELKTTETKKEPINFKQEKEVGIEVESQQPLAAVKEKVLNPTGETREEETKDYAKMIEEALKEEAMNPAAKMAPVVPNEPGLPEVPKINYLKEEDPKREAATLEMAQSEMSRPEMPRPEMPLPMPGDANLPVPPMPPKIDFEAALNSPTGPILPEVKPVMFDEEKTSPVIVNPEGVKEQNSKSVIQPAEPVVPPVVENLGENKVMQDQVYNDPSAFKIPGM